MAHDMQYDRATEIISAYFPLYRREDHMADTMNTSHFDRTIRTLETKLARQRSAVMDTEEMIKAVQALKEKEVAEHGAKNGNPKK